MIVVDSIQIVAGSVAAAVGPLLDLSESLSGVVSLIQAQGAEPWAVVKVGECYPGSRSYFPCYRDGLTGDADRRQAHMGVLVTSGVSGDRHIRLVLGRSVRMIRESNRSSLLA